MKTDLRKMQVEPSYAVCPDRRNPKKMSNTHLLINQPIV